MRVWIKLGTVAIGALGGYETWDYTRINPFHERTYTEEMIFRNAAPKAPQIEEIIAFDHGKKYTRTRYNEDRTETLTYTPEEGITLLIEHAGAEPITYVDSDADGFAEKHMIGLRKSVQSLAPHYCVPNGVPSLMYLDRKFHDPQAREGAHGFGAQKEYFVALMKFFKVE